MLTYTCLSSSSSSSSSSSPCRAASSCCILRPCKTVRRLSALLLFRGWRWSITEKAASVNNTPGCVCVCVCVSVLRPCSHHCRTETDRLRQDRQREEEEEEEGGGVQHRGQLLAHTADSHQETRWNHQTHVKEKMCQCRSRGADYNRAEFNPNLECVQHVTWSKTAVYTLTIQYNTLLDCQYINL